MTVPLSLEQEVRKAPRVLYKYRYFDRDGYGLRMLTHGEIYFADFSELNDPYEGVFVPESITSGMTDEEAIEYFKLKTAQVFKGGSDFEKQKLTNIAFRRFKMQQKNPGIFSSDMLELTRSHFRICSLTSNARSLPMWGYYADSHKGFCVGLDKNVLEKFISEAFYTNEHLVGIRKVVYSQKLETASIDTPIPNTKYDKVKDPNHETFHFTKSHQWVHESEYRLISYGATLNKVTLGPGLVSVVIIGMNTSPENIEMLVHSLKKVNSSAKLFKAERVFDQYELNLIPIEY